MGDGYSFAVEDMEKMEKLAIATSNRVMSAIESAVASFEAAGERPASLKPRIVRLKSVHSSLSVWERDMLLAARGTIEKRLSLLRKFGQIFR
ncbi:MAG: hypothetical protein AB1324_01625 [Candidatus Micrarchaeota archaeon]